MYIEMYGAFCCMAKSDVQHCCRAYICFMRKLHTYANVCVVPHQNSTAHVILKNYLKNVCSHIAGSTEMVFCVRAVFPCVCIADNGFSGTSSR